MLSTKSLKQSKIGARKGSYSRNWQEVIIAASDGTYASDIRLHQTVGLNVIANDAQYRASGVEDMDPQACLMNLEIGSMKNLLMK